MAGTRVEPPKTNRGEITLDLSAATGPAVGERQEDDQERQEDRKTDGGGGWVGVGEGRGRDVPCRRFSPFTLLSYKWGYHWPQGRRGEIFFFGRGRGVMEGQKRTKGPAPAREKGMGVGRQVRA